MEIGTKEIPILQDAQSTELEDVQDKFMNTKIDFVKVLSFVTDNHYVTNERVEVFRKAVNENNNEGRLKVYQVKKKCRTDMAEIEVQINEIEVQINEIEPLINEIEPQINEIEAQIKAKATQISKVEASKAKGAY